MRQLILKVPEGNKETIYKAVEENGGKNTISIPIEDHDVFILYLPNNKVNNFLRSIGNLDKREVNLLPQGIIALSPPESEAPDQVADVHPKSSLEIYLGGIQSVGSMFGLISYSIAAGAIVWIGLFTTTIPLLIAAMLVAPFAGPAMNAALATAAGKLSLLKSSLKRFGIAIFFGILTSYLLTLIFSLETYTPLMIQASQVSKFAIFLPLFSGFAAAINLCQPERDSLVSGAAVGILVAATLVPPTSLVGIGIYLQDWEVVFHSLFTVILQLLGIHLAASLVFYFHGHITPRGIQFQEGRKAVLLGGCIVAALGIGALMYWQFTNVPELRKASMNTELTEQLGKTLEELEYIEVVNKDASFTNTELHGKPVVNLQTTILPKDSTLETETVKKLVLQHLKNNLHYKDDAMHKVYEITVVSD